MRAADACGLFPQCSAPGPTIRGALVRWKVGPGPVNVRRNTATPAYKELSYH
jgi:hypothetical protein